MTTGARSRAAGDLFVNACVQRSIGAAAVTIRLSGHLLATASSRLQLLEDCHVFWSRAKSAASHLGGAMSLPCMCVCWCVRCA